MLIIVIYSFSSDIKWEIASTNKSNIPAKAAMNCALEIAEEKKPTELNSRFNQMAKYL